MLKIIGIFLFTVFCATVTATVTAKERKRCKSAEELYLLLKEIRHGVCEEARPLSDIYKSVSYPTLGQTPFIDILREKGLSDALESVPLPLPESLLSSLRLYASGLGRRFINEEIAESEKECEAFRLWLDSYRKDLPRRIRIQRTLSLFCGSAVLLLIL